MNHRPRPAGIGAVLAGIAALALVAGCASSGASSSSSARGSQLTDQGAGAHSPYLGFGLVPPQPRPSFTLTDTAGKPFQFGTVTSTHPTFLYYGYTHCPDVCPETMADIGIALGKVAPAVAARTYVVFVSTDVKHDTGPVIARWLSNFSGGSKAHWVGLRGSQAQIDAAQAVAHVAVAIDGGQTHSAQALLYGPDDYAHVTFLQTTTDEPKAMQHDLTVVAAAKSSGN